MPQLVAYGLHLYWKALSCFSFSFLFPLLFFFPLFSSLSCSDKRAHSAPPQPPQPKGRGGSCPPCPPCSGAPACYIVYIAQFPKCWESCGFSCFAVLTLAVLRTQTTESVFSFFARQFLFFLHSGPTIGHKLSARSKNCRQNRQISKTLLVNWIAYFYCTYISANVHHH